MWSPRCGLLTWRLICTGLHAFTNMTQKLTPRLRNVVLAFQTWVIFTVLYWWSLKQSIFACCLFTGKVTNHCHFLKNAYRLVINFYFKFDHSLKFEYKYKKSSWINLMGCTTTDILRIALIICKPLWETEPFKFHIFPHTSILPKVSLVDWFYFVILCISTLRTID